MEGLVTCLDCHPVHSGEVKYTVGDESRELCLSCHTSLSGPFIFEHEPVNEDCGICHEPHGTIADKLLIQNEPFLCLSCHPMHFHVTLVGYEGEFSAPMHPERTGVSTRDGMKQAMLTKCTQCHSEIHGSDLPSQSISGSGRALTR
jgi:DmsE family decaheme c-type cytochrome